MMLTMGQIFDLVDLERERRGMNRKEVDEWRQE